MDCKSELLAAYDDAWNAELNWESLGGTLKNISEEEAAFQHPVYSDTVPDPGFPANGTILWHIAHLTHCYRWYKAAIEERPSTPNDFDPIPITDLPSAIQDLKHHRDELRAAIASLADESLDEMLYYKQPVITLARSTVWHDAWHASQIAVAKRLYRMRDIHV